MFDNVNPWVVVTSYGGIMDSYTASHPWISVILIDYDEVDRKHRGEWDRNEVEESIRRMLMELRQITPGNVRKQLRLGIVQDYRKTWPIGGGDEDV